jgi:uncharacterized protein
LKSLRRILVIGEKNIFCELTQIIAIATQANALMLESLKEPLAEKTLNNCMHAIRELEKKADEETFKVGKDITTGAVSPNIIDNLLAALHLADDIVDIYYYLSRERCRMSKAKFPYAEASLETEWTALFRSILELADKALAKVNQALLVSDLSQLQQLRMEIQALEERGDDIKDEGFDRLYREAPSMHYLQFYHYTELLHKFDDILDGCEDLSDLIVSIITSILK